MISSYPIHRQSDSHCGAANLRGLVHYWTGKDYGEKRFSQLTNTTIEGCGAEDIMRAATHMGFNAQHISQERNSDMLEGLVRKGIFPIVCYFEPDYEEEHWATVLNVNSRVVLADTLLPGVRTFSKENFCELWKLKRKDKYLNETIIISPR